jgi:carboxynorspermidine decarboxylase
MRDAEKACKRAGSGLKACVSTPYYLIDEKKLLANMKIMARIREESKAKTLLALKCFSTGAVFPLMSRYMDGTTSSSVYEARLGCEEFGGETHAYCVGYSRKDVLDVKPFADKIIFNSISQLESYSSLVKHLPMGVRVNPGISYSHFDLANPARKNSRLGITDIRELERIRPHIKGVMFHFNCENSDAGNLLKNLNYISGKYGRILDKMEWVSLGGGLYFTRPGYPLSRFCDIMRNFAARHGVQIYLEPGESSITDCAELVTTVVDVVRNGADIAVVDACTEAHMLDLLIYRLSAKTKTLGRYKYIVAGRSCLAGDVFGTFGFPRRLKPGSTIRFADAAGYSMVKMNWFNGLPMPSIAVKRLDGTVDIVRSFNYTDFRNQLGGRA